MFVFPTIVHILAQSILTHAEFRCYEAKIEKSEKAGSCQESNSGHLWLELTVLCHRATTARRDRQT